jgi:hypothetical protein
LHYIFTLVAYRQQLYQYRTPIPYTPTVEDRYKERATRKPWVG